MAIEERAPISSRFPISIDGNGMTHYPIAKTDTQIGRIPNAQIESLFAAIDGLARLRKNWNTYGAEPPNAAAISNAKNVLERCIFMGIVPTKVLASAEEGVAVIFDDGEKYADIESFNTGEILAIISNRHSEPVVWTIDSDTTDSALERIREFLSI